MFACVKFSLYVLFLRKVKMKYMVFCCVYVFAFSGKLNFSFISSSFVYVTV